MQVVMRTKMMAVMMGKATTMMQTVIKKRIMGMQTLMMKMKTSTKTTMIVEMVVLIVRTKVLMVQSAL